MREEEKYKGYENQEGDYLKKYKKKINILKYIILIIIITFIAIILRRIIIMTVLSNRANQEKIKGDNYYARVEEYSNGALSIGETYYKEGNFLTKTISYDEYIGEQEIIFYKNGDEQFTLLNHGNSKSKSEEFIPLQIEPVEYTYSFWGNLIAALSITIDKAELNGIKCYVLKDKYQERYINKDTGLTVKLIEKANNRISEYHYEYGVVEQIVRPDVSEYEDR